MTAADKMLATVLAVDDEPLNNELMERAFRGRADRRLLVAPSGEQALAVLQRERIDVLLVDYSMPRMTGVQFLEQAMVLAPGAVSIMVTGYPELKDVVEAQSRGLVRHIIAKPWRLSDLLDTVDRALSMRELSVAVTRLRERQDK